MLILTKPCSSFKHLIPIRFQAQTETKISLFKTQQANVFITWVFKLRQNVQDPCYQKPNFIGTQGWIKYLEASKYFKGHTFESKNLNFMGTHDWIILNGSR